MEAERLLYMFALILPAFGLARLVWERKLEVSRKAVTGTNAFSSTVLGGIVGTGALWKRQAVISMRPSMRRLSLYATGSFAWL